MRKIFILFIMLFTLFSVVACDMGGTTPHKHSYVEGKCSCGEVDPNYKEPVHEHKFVDGKCSCGAIEEDNDPVEYTITYELDGGEFEDEPTLKFSDGSELKTINQHRIFNKEAGKFN